MPPTKRPRDPVYGTVSYPHMSTSVLIALCTCPDAEVAGRIARALVGEGLAACVSAGAGSPLSTFGTEQSRPTPRSSF